GRWHPEQLWKMIGAMSWLKVTGAAWRRDDKVAPPKVRHIRTGNAFIRKLWLKAGAKQNAKNQNAWKELENWLFPSLTPWSSHLRFHAMNRAAVKFFPALPITRASPGSGRRTRH